MKKANKKLVGGFMVVMLISTIGAVIASAVDDETTEDDTQVKTFWGRRQMFGPAPFFSDLTEEQQAELNEIRENLLEEGATPEEIREAIQLKLDEYGVLDEQLDATIERTEQQLEILNRKKELREQGYNWEEIDQMIQEEFDLDAIVGDGQGMIFRHRGRCGQLGIFSGSMPDDLSDL